MYNGLFAKISLYLPTNFVHILERELLDGLYLQRINRTTDFTIAYVYLCSKA